MFLGLECGEEHRSDADQPAIRVPGETAGDAELHAAVAALTIRILAGGTSDGRRR